MSANQSDPTAAEILARAGEEGVWRVPVELVLACPSASAIKTVVQQRIVRGDMPKASARVFYRGQRLFAQVAFKRAGAVDLLFALDIWELV